METSKRALLTMVWVEEVWLPSSSDCNPFDYFVCGVSELRVKAKSRNNPKDLIQKMKEICSPLPGTPWRRPARASGPGSKLSSQYLIVNMYLCLFLFTSIKSAEFQLCNVKKRKKKKIPDLSLPPCIHLQTARPNTQNFASVSSTKGC
jgi:hypothetical protein